MRQRVEVRELKNQACRLIRRISHEMAEYVVTLRGKAVALLHSLAKEEVRRLRQVEVQDSLAEMKALAQQVAEAWISDKSGVQLVSDQRR